MENYIASPALLKDNGEWEKYCILMLVNWTHGTSDEWDNIVVVTQLCSLAYTVWHASIKKGNLYCFEKMGLLPWFIIRTKRVRYVHIKKTHPLNLNTWFYQFNDKYDKVNNKDHRWWLYKKMTLRIFIRSAL